MRAATDGPSAQKQLRTYRAKRDPDKTPEPMGSRRKKSDRKGSALRFVIQEHHARALHWDFRLEHDGVFVSWALPKGLPESPKSNHLAVHTEDHPIEYGEFQGDIPKGEYGGGHVSIWDQGTYELEKWSDREVMVVLHGQIASGRYVLFSTGARTSSTKSPASKTPANKKTGTDDKNWMIHRMDEAPEGFEPMPARVAPMLALLKDSAPEGDNWAYEFKWDGVRAIVYVEGGRVRATTRNDKDLVATFPELRSIGEFLGSRSAVLDGELVAFDQDGRPSFGLLQQRLHLGSRTEVVRRSHDVPASYLAFDLLYLDGRPRFDLSYDERRKLLDSLKLAGESFATPPSFSGGQKAGVLQTTKDRGLEGIVAKRRTSPYRQGSRNGDWVKVKIFRTQEVVIGGWTEGKGGRARTLGALLLGIPTKGALGYVGKVGTGFDDATLRDLLQSLESLEQPASPFQSPLTRAQGALAHFVRPELVGEVRYAEWTHDGHLRHPSWRGLRPDKQASQVVRED
jgi:bifunctional non-homologous end joining protein LigD